MRAWAAAAAAMRALALAGLLAAAAPAAGARHSALSRQIMAAGRSLGESGSQADWQVLVASVAARLREQADALDSQRTAMSRVDKVNNETAGDAQAAAGAGTASVHHPALLIMEGCSGSTATIKLARALTAAHGHPAADLYFEELRPETNAYYREHGPPAGGKATMEDAIMAQYKEATSQGLMLLQKLELRADEGANAMYAGDAVLSPVIANTGARAVFVWRRNVLDMLTCFVRDCFLAKNSPIGEVVTENGTDPTLCYKRRAAAAKGNPVR